MKALDVKAESSPDPEDEDFFKSSSRIVGDKPRHRTSTFAKIPHSRHPLDQWLELNFPVNDITVDFTWCHGLRAGTETVRHPGWRITVMYKGHAVLGNLLDRGGGEVSFHPAESWQGISSSMLPRPSPPQAWPGTLYDITTFLHILTEHSPAFNRHIKTREISP